MSVCLIGQVFVDVTLSPRGENKLRLGGVMHAARAMWALGVEYRLAYAAPAYMTSLVQDFAMKHGASGCERIADICGSPSVVLIPEPTEAGSQGYEVLLRESQKATTSEAACRALATDGVSDALIFPGGYELKTVLRALSNAGCRCYIDIAYDVPDLDMCRELGRKFEVVMTSTSSPLFETSYNRDPSRIRDAIVGVLSSRLLFKENRGGSRLFNEGGAVIEMGAQLGPTVHSVGVGDCFNVAFAVLRKQHSDEVALAYASFIAAEYAATTFPEDFREGVRRAQKIEPKSITKITGVRLPWESRKAIGVYIAAPDFDYLDRSPIVAVDEALKYHNFSPRRPVLEHGQASANDSHFRRRELFDLDMALLSECQIVVAVLIEDDPGTFIEIGLAKQQGKPVIVFDPFGLAKNLVLQQLPDALVSSLDETVSAVFEAASRLTKVEHDS